MMILHLYIWSKFHQARYTTLSFFVAEYRQIFHLYFRQTCTILCNQEYNDQGLQLSVLLSPTYAFSDSPQSLQELAEGHLLCLHPQDHPPKGQWKTSCPAKRHFCRKMRQLACFFLNDASESGWWWSGRERGTVAVASPAEQKGRTGGMQQGELAQDVTAWLASCAKHGCWRREMWERGGVCSSEGCLWEMDAFEDAAEEETDDGVMLKLLRPWQPQLQWRRVLCRGMQSAGCRRWRWGGGGAGGSLISTCMLQPQHTWWCKPVQTCQTERGRGSEGQPVQFHTISWSNSDIQCGGKAWQLCHGTLSSAETCIVLLVMHHW